MKQPSEDRAKQQWRCQSFEILPERNRIEAACKQMQKTQPARHGHEQHTGDDAETDRMIQQPPERRFDLIEAQGHTGIGRPHPQMLHHHDLTKG